MTHPLRLELPTPFPIGSVNSYLYLEPEPALFDCGVGTETCWVAFQEALDKHGLAVGDLSRVYVSHAHVDHMGLAANIAQNSQAVFLCSPLVATWLADFPRQWAKRGAFLSQFLPKLNLSPELEQVMTGGMTFAGTLSNSIPADRIQIVPLDGAISLGGMTWSSIYLPGHAASQCCLLQSDTGMFLGADMLLSRTPTPVIEAEPGSPTERSPGLKTYLNSIRVVERLDISAVFPGHGQPFTNVGDLLHRQRSRIDQRKEQCRQLISTGVDTVGALVDLMYPGYGAGAKFSAVAMVVGYVDLLLEDNLICRRTLDNVWRLSA